ncbi:MAG: hypothetical protein H6721_05710 [Sandaracinus sp.]|nr:hypothetical protein [Sandaracinus sp.]MCB9631622.1 hypothetical protein [Sandaracinus sp.]
MVGPFCDGQHTDSCIDPFGGGMQWRESALWSGAQPHPHLLDPHLRRLRNAAERHEGCLGTLEHNLNVLARSLTTRDEALVWESHSGRAQCMEQAEAATLFASSAGVLAAASRHAAARRFMAVSHGLLAALSREAAPLSGGCSVPLTGQTNEPQRWFSSRGLGIETDGRTPWVLNQHLHAVYQLLQLSSIVRRPEIDSALAAADHRLARQLAIEGLRALVSHDELALERWFYHPTPAVDPRHVWVYYSLDDMTRAGRNISRAMTCHYGEHVLKKLDDIHAWLRANHDAEIADLVEVLDRSAQRLREASANAEVRAAVGCRDSVPMGRTPRD